MTTTHRRALRALLALSLAALMSYPSSTAADNPIVQTLYTADPAPLVHEGRVYVFAGHDEDQLVNGFFTMNDWRVYSSADMANWTDHGMPLSHKAFRWSTGDAWAAQVVSRGGKFYFYVTTNRNGARVIGVAVSDTLTGPYRDALGKPLITSGCGDIDPTVFVDDDGQAYLYWGNPNLCYVKLNEDMISYAGEVVRVPLTTSSFGARSKPDRTTTYEEGPWLYKRQGRYYMVFAGGPISEHIGYAMSPGPTGPWSYGGIIMPSEGASFTNHAGIIDYKGKSYFFYHNGALPAGGGFHRSIAVEEFAYGDDGKIPRLKMTKQGPEPVATLDPYSRTEAETIAFSVGVRTEPCTDEGGGMNLTSLANGDYLKLRNVDFGIGATTFEARVSSAGSQAKIEIRLDSLTGPLVGTCDVSNVASWSTKSCATADVAGRHDLFLKFTGGTGELFKFNWWRFAGIGMPYPKDAGTPAADDAAGFVDGGPSDSGVASRAEDAGAQRRDGGKSRNDAGVSGESGASSGNEDSASNGNAAESDADGQDEEGERPQHPHDAGGSAGRRRTPASEGCSGGAWSGRQGSGPCASLGVFALLLMLREIRRRSTRGRAAEAAEPQP